MKFKRVTTTVFPTYVGWKVALGFAGTDGRLAKVQLLDAQSCGALPTEAKLIRLPRSVVIDPNDDIKYLLVRGSRERGCHPWVLGGSFCGRMVW
jgi:hypothetical protein